MYMAVVHILDDYRIEETENTNTHDFFFSGVFLQENFILIWKVEYIFQFKKYTGDVKCWGNFLFSESLFSFLTILSELNSEDTKSDSFYNNKRVQIEGSFVKYKRN